GLPLATEALAGPPVPWMSIWTGSAGQADCAPCTSMRWWPVTPAGSVTRALNVPDALVCAVPRSYVALCSWIVTVASASKFDPLTVIVSPTAGAVVLTAMVGHVVGG